MNGSKLLTAFKQFLRKHRHRFTLTRVNSAIDASNRLWNSPAARLKRATTAILILVLLITNINFLLVGRVYANDLIRPIGNNQYENVNPDFRVLFSPDSQADGNLKIRFEGDRAANSIFSVSSQGDDHSKKGLDMLLVGAGTDFPTNQLTTSKQKLADTITSYLSASVQDPVERKNYINGYIASLDEIFHSSEKTLGKIEYTSRNSTYGKDTIVNAEATAGVDVKYEIMAGEGLKESIIMKNADGMGKQCIDKAVAAKSLTLQGYCKLPRNAYAFSFKLDAGLTIQSTGFNNDSKSNIGQTYYIADSEGRYVGHFAPLFAVDAVENKTENVSMQISKLGENEYQAVVMVDMGWLLNSNRNYPITIDPSIVHNTQAQFDLGTKDRVETTSTPKVQLAAKELPADINTVGLWHLNETSNGTCSGGADACDTSGYGNNGTNTGAAIDTSTQKLGAAARSFNGTSNYVTIPRNSIFEPPTAITLEAWVKWSNPTGVAPYQTIVSKDRDTAVAPFISYQFSQDNTSSNYFFSINVGGTQYTTPDSPTVTLGIWHHLAGTWSSDSKQANFYYDGVFVGSISTTSGSITYYNTPLRIGAESRTSPASFFNGSVDEVRISNISRTPEEIKADAQVRPSGVYTSSVLDLGTTVSTIDSLQWNENGVRTGINGLADGETPFSTTGLLAQWNFNATSGTTATNDAGAGSCAGTPANCNGTLTSFASTASQDAAVGTGWTSNKRRWGAGGLMFDGTDDFVDIANSAAVNPLSAITVSAWVKLDSLGNYRVIVAKDATTSTRQWQLVIDNNNYPYFNFSSNGTVYDQGVAPGVKAVDTNWHMVTATFDGTVVSLYLDGIILKEIVTTASTIFNGSSHVNIGRQEEVGANNYFDGSIDAVSIYSRSLSAAEVLSNYQSSNIEFQTRTGTTTDPNDGTWEAWKPTTAEVQIDSMDSLIGNTRIYPATNEWTLNNVTAGQNWVKYDNSSPAASDTTSTNGHIPLGISGGDSVKTEYPSIIKDGNTYKMWYSGNSGTNIRIYYATSTDGLIWTKVDNSIPTASNTTGTNGRIPLGTSGGDTANAYSPSVIKDGSTYKMWYIADPGNSLTQVYYATSPDGLTWTKNDNTIPTASNTTGTNGRIPVGLAGSGDFNGIVGICVIKDGSTYKAWYTGNYSTNVGVFYATSPDGLTWTKFSDVTLAASNTTGTNGRIPPGLAGSGDVNAIVTPTVIKDGSTYKMWYSASDVSGVNRVYYATSPDGLTWTKVDNSIPTASNTNGTNGRVPISTSGGDNTFVFGESVIKDGNTYKMWYTGSDGTNYRIYHAVMNATPESYATDSATKIEGTGATKTQLGMYQPGGQTAGLWHLEETGGSGAYIKDATGRNVAATSINTGTGTDGAITISTAKNITTDAIETGRPTCLSAVPCADGIAYKVTAPADNATSVTAANTPTGIATNDEVMIINLQGTSADNADVGHYEFKTVQSVVGTTITFTSPITKSYDGTTAANQQVVVQRVPNYTSVTLATGGNLTASGWDGLTATPANGAGYLTGIVVFRATGTVSVATGANITVSGKGYRGGAGGTTAGGQNGESYDGFVGSGGNDTIAGSGGGNAGTSGGGSSSNATTSGAVGKRGGGGGGGNTDGDVTTDGAGGGGGGSYGSGGGGGNGGRAAGATVGAPAGAGSVGGGGGGAGCTTGAGGAGGSSAAGSAGAGTSAGGGGVTGAGAFTGGGGIGSTVTTVSVCGAGGGGGGGIYGSADLSTAIFLGSGGGGGGGHDNGPTAGQNGSNGGGIIFITSNIITVTSTGRIDSLGTSGSSSTNRAGAGGGGSGGSIFLSANSASLGANIVSAVDASFVVSNGAGGSGGVGGDGRINIQVPSGNISGGPTPTSSIASASNADLTPTGSPTITDGYSGKAYTFNGSTQYLSCTDANCGGTTRLDPGSGAFSVGAWIKTTSSATQYILSKGTATYAYQLTLVSGIPHLMLGNTIATNFKDIAAFFAVNDNNWHYVVGIWNGVSGDIYIDGTSNLNVITGSGTQVTDSSADFNIARRADNTGFFNGSIDEVFVEHRTLSADEIAELYRGVRDYRTSRTISSTDLSASTKIPFYVASDRQGQFMEATIGESAYANYEADANTAAFWHLEEQTGSSAYFRDSSVNDNNGTPTGTTFTQGKIGKGRNFNGTTDYILVSAIAGSLNINANPVTLEAWVRPNSVGTLQVIMSRGTAGTNGYALRLNTTNKINLGAHGSGNFDGQTSLVAGQWYHVVGVINGASSAIYLNGQLDGTGTVNVVTSTLDFRIGADFNGTTQTSFFNGAIDEVRVSSNARTADEIRQAYEYSNRTHPIIIDFKAKLDAGNLITGSGDTSFTIDSTAYGAANKADNLALGDKIIVKENNNGTEYIAQGTVKAVSASSGAVTVAAWDAGATFPAGGFTVNATVFKWQREYFDLTKSLTTQRDATTRITLRTTDVAQGATFWLDDMRYNTNYLTNPAATGNVTSTVQRYMQYRAIFSTTDTSGTAYLSSVTTSTTTAIPTTDQLMRHGKYFSGGVIQNFWWAN